MSPRRPRSLLGPSKPIDRRIPGIGRIRVPSGLADGAQWRAMNDMVTELARDDDGRALLREVDAGRLQIDVLRTHHKLGTLHLVPLGTAASALVAALETWREDTKRDVSPDTYRVRKELVTAIKAMPAKLRPKGPAIVAALPDYVRVLRVHMNGARSFNLLRAYALAFVRDTLGKQSSVYAGVQGVPPRKVRPTKRKRPLQPFELRAIALAFDTVRAARIAASTAKRGVRPIEAKGDDAIIMALTGMNPKEHAGTWIAAADRVRISGTKREGRVRDVPKAFPCALWPSPNLAPPSVGAKNFSRWFREAADVAGIPCTPYDLRRTFANWMESAGVPRTRRRMYLGHASADVTDVYEWHEVTAYLIEDGAKLRAWIDGQLSATEVADSPVNLTIIRPEKRTARA